MLPYLLTVLLYLGCIVASSVSGPSWAGPEVFTLLIVVIGGIVLSLSLTPWFAGSFLQRIKKTTRWGFPLSGLLFLAGYGYVLLETVIREP